MFKPELLNLILEEGVKKILFIKHNVLFFEANDKESTEVSINLDTLNKIIKEWCWNQSYSLICERFARDFEICKIEPRHLAKIKDNQQVFLFAAVFAYICSISFDFRLPDNRTASESKERIIWKGITLPDGTFTRVPVKKQA